MCCSHCNVMRRRLRWNNDYIDNEMERTIIEKLVTVYANAPSRHSVQTPRQALNQYLIFDSNQELPLRKSDMSPLILLCWKKNTYLQCCNVICTKWNVTNYRCSSWNQTVLNSSDRHKQVYRRCRIFSRTMKITAEHKTHSVGIKRGQPRVKNISQR